jgi:hypothetical protein
MAIGEVVLALLALKVLSAGSSGDSAPPDAGSLPGGTAVPPTATAGGQSLVGAVGGVVTAAVPLGTLLVNSLSTTGTSAIGGAVAGATVTGDALQVTGEAFLQGGVEGAGAAAANTASAILTGIASGLIVSAAIVIAEKALSELTNLAIAQYLKEQNRQKRKQLGAAYLVTKELNERETSWNLLLLKSVNATTNLAYSGISTNVNGVVEYLGTIDQVSGVEVAVQQVVASLSRYLAVQEVRAHNDAVRAFFSSTMPLVNSTEFVDTVSDADLSSIINAWWSQSTTWGITPAFNQVDAQLNFSNNKAAAIARFYGSFSGLLYVATNYGNQANSWPCNLQTVVASAQCVQAQFMSRCGFAGWPSAGTWPERWYFDNAAGLAIGFSNGSFRRKTKRVAELLAAGHYVPPSLQQIYNDEDAGKVARLSLANEIGRQSQFDATPLQFRVPS